MVKNIFKSKTWCVLYSNFKVSYWSHKNNDDIILSIFLVIVSFPLDEDPKVSIIAWTTTPWTLPSNLALCVNPTMDYVKIKHQKDGNTYIMLEARLPALFKKANEYKVLEK